MFGIMEKFYESITRKRSLSKSKSLETKLDRCLSTPQLIFYGISNMIGAGIYVLTGHMIKDRVGPGSNLSFLFSGLISVFTGLCYCEFSTLIPKAGSCYTYTYLMMGELPAFVIGWTMVLDLIIGMASVAKGFSGAVNLLFNDAIRNFTERIVPLHTNSEIWESSVDLLAILLLFTLFLITLTGANISMNINSILAMIQICLLSTIIISCFVYGNGQRYVADGGYLPYGVLAIFQGSGIAIFAYSGFETLANSAEETKNPKKSIPIALFTSLSIVILLYISASTALPYMVPRLQIDVTAPFIAAFASHNLIALKWISGIATVLATGASKLTSMYIIPRMIYAMSEDGLLFSFLGIVNKRTRVPIPALIVGILFSMILAMLIKIQILADITSMGIILSFVIIGVDLIILRYLYEDPTEESETSNNRMMKMRFAVHPIFTEKKVFKIIVTGMLISIILMGLSLHFIYPISDTAGKVCLGLTVVWIVISLICLSLYEPRSSKDAFETPLMPLTPFITIILNTTLLIYLPGGTWLRFFIWLAIGFIIYFTYGIRYSNLSNTDDETKELINMNDDKTDKTEKMQ